MRIGDESSNGSYDTCALVIKPVTSNPITKTAAQSLQMKDRRLLKMKFNAAEVSRLKRVKS